MAVGNDTQQCADDIVYGSYLFGKLFKLMIDFW